MMEGAASFGTLRRRRKSKLVTFERPGQSSPDISTQKSKDVTIYDDQSIWLNQSAHQQKERKSFQECLSSSPITCKGIPEVHWIGEIHQGSGFSQPTMACKWTLEWGESWSLLEGNYNGQSQFSFLSDDGTYIWNHPIDLHLACTSLKGVPRIILQLWELDEYNRLNHVGYGFAHLPLSPGETYLKIPCWRPYSTFQNEMKEYFLGSSKVSHETTIVYHKAWDNRHSLVTIPLGQVHIHISTITRYMSGQSVEMA